MCVQRFDDSLNSAIHTTYRISLRSSSMREPRDPLLKVLTCLIVVTTQTDNRKPGFEYHCRAFLTVPGRFRHSCERKRTEATEECSQMG